MRPHRYFGILSGLVLLSTAALSSTAALAAASTDAPTVRVNYLQADLQDSAAAERLYRRIQHAARMVCQQPSVREIDRYRAFKACYQRAVGNAVANVGATALTQVHHSHTQTAG